MEKFSIVIQFVLAHYPEMIAALVAILTGVIGISLLVPGEQPEKALKAIVDFLSKFSRK